MSSGKSTLFNKIVLLATVTVWAFASFCFGVIVANTETFKEMWQETVSGVAGAELLPYAKEPLDQQLTVWTTTTDALQGGALLIGSNFSKNPALLLVDEKGHILHHWNVEQRIFNNEFQKWWKEPQLLDTFAIDDAHLLPGGDVVFLQQLKNLGNYQGQRIARMDRDSHVLWEVPGAFHHVFDIAGKPQRLYAIKAMIRDELPVIGPKLEKVRYIEDWIEVYTMDGKKVSSWSVVDAFANSPFRNLLSSYEIDLPNIQRVRISDGLVLYDMIHTNSVQYLDAAQAKALPSAQEGDLLISSRGLNTLAVFRPALGQIVWASQGPWRHQHYARVTAEGKLYVYDNEGSQSLALYSNGTPHGQLQSRVLHVDPFKGRFEEIYASPKLHSFWSGYYHPLADGSHIISSSQRSRVMVVSPEKKVIWELRGISDREKEAVPFRKQISTVHYYPASALEFLKH